MPVMAGGAQCACGRAGRSDFALTLPRPSQARRRLELMMRGPKLVSAHSLAGFARVTGENW